MRKSDGLFISLAVLSSLFAMTLFDAYGSRTKADSHLSSMARMVQRLELTDLSLFTEARYTRHLTQSDYHTAFQDHPLAIEHFPSGSLVRPPFTH